MKIAYYDTDPGDFTFWVDDYRIGSAPVGSKEVTTGQFNAPRGTYRISGGVVVSSTAPEIAAFNAAQSAIAANSDVTLKAPLDSPVFTGIPAAPTAAFSTNTTQLATTAFVQAAVSGSVAGVSSFNTRTGPVTLTSSDVTTALTYTPVNPASAAITNGTIDGTTIGATTATTGRFTTIESTTSTGTAPFIVASTTTVANLNIGGNSANVTGTVAIANGGTGQITSQAAANALVNRPNTIASSSTPTPVADTTDIFTVTALATAATFGIPTYTITPVDGQGLLIRIKDNGGAQTLAWNIIYRAVGVTLPITTVPNKTLYVGMFYNFTDTKWDVVGVAQE